MNAKIDNLHKLFLQHISLGSEVDNEILTEIDGLLYSLNQSSVEMLREGGARLSSELHEIGTASVPYLLLLLLNKLEAVSFKPKIKKRKLESSSAIDQNSFMNFIKTCFKSCSETGIRIFDFKIPQSDNLNKLDIYCGVRSLLDMSISEPININALNEDLPPIGLYLGISKILSHELKCQHEFYIQFSSILERMNRDGLYQEARDWAEEALLCSHAYEELYYGHYAKFSLYSKQMNIIDSLLNGCLLLTSLCEEKEVCNELMKKVYVEIFIMLRTFNFFEHAKEIYKTHVVSLKLDEYEMQKCDLAMFYLRLMEQDSGLIGHVDAYVRNNRESIMAYGKSSLIPWFAFICNVKSVFSGSLTTSRSIIDFENEIANLLPIGEADALRNKIMKDRSGSKISLISGLKNLSRTRNRADFIHEVNQLVVTANRVIDSSVRSGDVEGVLLGHQLKSDGSVYFDAPPLKSENGLIIQSYNLENNNSSRFDRYLEYVRKAIAEDSSLQFLWLGFNRDKLYCVIFDDGDFTFAGYVDSTNKNEISGWLREHLAKLAFEDTPNTGSPFVTREDHWIEERDSIIDSLPCIDIPISSRDIVLFSDVEFSSFPHNLIKSKNKLVYLEQTISSPLSFDNFIRHKEVKINAKEIYAWAPVVEGDMAISIAYSKLKEEVPYVRTVFDEGAVPNPCKDINLFISHGGRNEFLGFSGLYPKSGKAYDTSKIFGHGKLAILFVCHAGSIVENIFSNSTHTLAKKLLESGYETVISPSWSLNVSIPGIWTREFIDNFSSGLNASQSVHKANVIVDSMYLSPSASGAMHLFGNGKIVSV